MGRQWALFLCALQFLTRLPTPAIRGFEPDWITRSARWFSLVGQGVGLFCALALLVGLQIWSPWIAALVALAIGALITGALHEDGLADCLDGLWGGARPERRLEIMRDSRIGTYGALGLMLTLGLKAACLASLTPAGAAWALVAAHGLARAATAALMASTPYAPGARNGKWTPTAAGVSPGEAAVAVVIGLWPLLFLGVGAAMAGLIGGAALGGAMAVIARRRLGGHTGDVLGAVEQLFELGFLLGAAAVLRA